MPLSGAGGLAARHDGWLLFPLAALIGTAFLTQLFTGSFHWAYPVHVGVAAWVAWQVRAVLPPLQFGNPWLAVLAGGVMFGIWIALIPADAEAALQFRDRLFAVGPAWVAAWLILRVAGAALVVPLVEELAFRAYLLRMVERRLSTVLPALWAMGGGLAASTLAFGLLHGEWLAGCVAGLAYGLVYLRSGKVYDAVLAHAVTNFLLALYVMVGEQWSYW